ncbi:MAG: signal peptidase I [Elusimicrobiaceae bacterium]|nr:signal peptidase I [Elusimicrobiaceae bacterium]
MEWKLTIIGLVFAAYAAGTWHFLKRRPFQKAVCASLWNSIFWALAGFLVVFVLFFAHGRGIGHLSFNTRLLLSGLIVAGCAGAGFFRHKDDPVEYFPRIFTENAEWTETLAGSILIASGIMFFFIQAFSMPSSSMYPALSAGDRLFVNKIKYGVRVPFSHKRYLRFKKVEKGDVVVFDFPASSAAEVQCGGVQYGKEFIKRVVAGPGDTVEIRAGVLLVNGAPFPEDERLLRYRSGELVAPPELKEDASAYQTLWEKRGLGNKYEVSLRDYFGPVKVPPDSYFVLGDRREKSCDSRFWGPVPQTNIKGTGMFVYWPPAHIKKIK